MDEVSLNDARFAQNHVNASSIAELRIDCGEIKGLEIFSSKCGEFSVTGDSALRDLQVSASTLKEVRISAKTRWIDSAINASVLAEFRRSAIPAWATARCGAPGFAAPPGHGFATGPMSFFAA